MRYKKIIALMAAVMLPWQSVSAQLIESVEVNNGKVTVTGHIDGYRKGDLLTLLLLKNDKNASDMENMEKPINVMSDAAVIRADENGDYSYTMTMTNADGAIWAKRGNETQTVSLTDHHVEGNTVYVAPNGNDGADGTMAAPLKTFAAAVRKVRQIKANDANTPITVYFMPGEYRLSETVNLNANDSGSAKAPIMYKAYEKGTVTFKGSVEIPVSDLQDVTDHETLSRLPVISTGKVKKVDLKNYGITDEMVRFKLTMNDYEVNEKRGNGSPAPLGLYLNGKRQNIARWPNVGYNDFKDSDGNSQRIVNQSNGRCTSFYFEETNPVRWNDPKALKYAYIDGYLETGYAGVWRNIQSVDTENKIITISEQTYGDVKRDSEGNPIFDGNGQYIWDDNVPTITNINADNRRWTAVNLLEELDMPSEFYIDRSTSDLTLYYYPAYELGAGDKLEYAALQNNMLKLSNVNYVTFKDLGFKQSYSNAVEGENCTHVTFDGCDISDLRRSGIYMWGKDIVVKNGTFANISGTGISVNTGNLQTMGDIAKLIPSGIKVLNNHIYNVGFDIRAMGCGVEVSGVGARVENNVIHMSTNRAASATSPDTVIGHNEAYNLVRDTVDAGGFYVGRSWTMYGNKYEYNYMHHFGILEYPDSENTSCIFLDDTISGQYVQNNIFVNDYVSEYKTNDGTYFGAYGVNINGGRDMTIKNNVFVGMDYAIRNSDLASGADYVSGHQSLYNELKSLIESYSNSKYVAKYPGMQALYNDINATNYFTPKNMALTGNVIADLQQNTANGVLLTGRTNNNTNSVRSYMTNNSAFVNAAAGDYRVKNSKVAELGLNSEEGFALTEDFDLDSIGMIGRSIETGDAFKKVYPMNGAKIQKSTKADLFWEQAMFADEYDYVVATDAEMNNVVASGTTFYKSVTVEGLTPNTEYYWQVTARNYAKQSKTNGDTWMADNGETGHFVTSAFDISAFDTAVVRNNDGTLKLSAYVENESNANITGDLIIAGFDSEGRLVKIDKSAKTFNAGIHKVGFDTTESFDDAEALRIYIWNGIDTMKPLTADKLYPRK